MRRCIALLAVFTVLLAQAARADVRSDAVRLLAQRVRQTGVDPKNIAISGVVVRGDQALLSWNSGKQHGVMGLLLSADRWWDALDMTATPDPEGCWFDEQAYPLVSPVPYPASSTPLRGRLTPNALMLQMYGFHAPLIEAAAAENADVRAANARPMNPDCRNALYHRPPDVRVRPDGARVHPVARESTSGYDITIAYAPNDAGPDAKLAQLFVRAPTLAEFAPSHAPAPGFGGPDAVCFFDVQIAGSKPVTFARGTTIDIWFPFVLDDQLRYNLTFFSADKPSGMIFGTIFDNTLHFVVPQFTLVPDKPLMAEIDGDPKGSS